MPQPDNIFAEKSVFERSDEWQKILKILDSAEFEHIEVCTDANKGIEAIRFSQGAIETIRSFREIPSQIFGEVKDNGSNPNK